MTSRAEIYQPTTDFNFEKIRLLSPNSGNGSGNYLIKFRLNDCPIYIQTPKCFTKNGIFKSGKKMYCDLLFSNENNEFVNWMEYLEIFCKKRLFEKREDWFESDLDENDIDMFFTSPFKYIKSGQNYIVRAYIPSILGSCNLKIYNEKEEEQPVDSLTEETQIVCILEIQGIKCSPKIFQIEIEIKQMMILDQPEKLFSKCAIQGVQGGSAVAANLASEKISMQDTLPTPTDIKLAEKYNEQLSLSPPPPPHQEDILVIKPTKQKKSSKKKNIEYETFDDDTTMSNKQSAELNITEPETTSSTIEEFQFNLDNIPEMDKVHIKKRNDIYYQLYKDAKRKAKIARDLALSSYLQAKQIKSIYMLDDIKDSDDSEEDYDSEENDDDSDEDNEI